MRRPLPAGAAVPRGRTGPFERLSRIPDHRVVDRLLRSRACIWVIGILLGGIVAMQVSLLRLNAGISRAVTTQHTFEQQNAAMQARIAELASGERVRAAALKTGMIDPAAGDTRFLTAHPLTDPARALKRMRPPSQRAEAIMAGGGSLPDAFGTTVAGAPGAGAVSTSAVQAAAAAAGATTPAPVTTPTPTVAAPTPTVAPTATPPVPTVAPTVVPTVAPQG